MKIRNINKSFLIVMAAILLSVSLVAAIFVFMSEDKTIASGNTASFTCTVDPMLGPASYEVKLVGNGVNKVLTSGTNAASVFDVPVSVGPSDYGSVALNTAKTYDVQCTAEETSCDPCCCDTDTQTSKLTVYNCPADGWMCDANEVRQHWRYSFNGAQCVYTVDDTGEDCDIDGGAYGDGCYAYGNGCEDRDWYCVEGVGTGTPCSYDQSNRHTDSYDSYVFYCKDDVADDDLYKHRKFYDYACNGAHSGTCVLASQSWADNTLVQDCGVDSCDEFRRICGTGADANKVFNTRTCHDRGCEAAACFDKTSTETNFVENCDVRDGWYDTGNTKWVADQVCSEKEQKEQAYKNYVCVAGGCTFTVTDTQWVNTGNVRYKSAATMCRASAGVCDVAEKCTGTSAACPGDSKLPSTTVCRADAGQCDIAEKCTGTTNDCPTDAFEPDGTTCNDGLYCTNPDTCQSGNCQGGQNRDCSDSLFCTINERCDEALDRCTSEPKSCSAFNISQIATCDNNPDNYHYTWDFRAWFTSICDENADKCTTGNEGITHTCDKDCGAPCESNADCNDGNTHTTDICLANCTCKHDNLPYCGDNIVQTSETCELPNTNNNNYCSQTTNGGCSGKKTGVRDAFGNCNTSCGCTYDSFNYMCIKDQCGAACDSNDDCDDGNSHTTDTCLNDCTCKHDTEEYCGDGNVGAGETCELPSTNNNAYCTQSTTKCSGTKLGTRDSKGNCSSTCGCKYDSYNYQCVKGQCGATCAVNADCDDSNINTADTCLNNCTCKHETLPYCGDGVIQTGEQCELIGAYANWGEYGHEYTCNENNTYKHCVNCQYQEVNECKYYCSASQQCEGVAPMTYFESCTAFGFNYLQDYCDANCHIKDDNCESNYTGCTAEAQCDELAPNTGDCNYMCQYKPQPQPKCGDGIINLSLSEKCELPNTANNTNCPQSDCEYLNGAGVIRIMNGDGCDVCEGNKLGTRDHYGDCNAVCGCVEDSYIYSCVKGKCGAVCDSNDDCNDGNASTTDTCLGNCTCKHDTQHYCGNGVSEENEACDDGNSANGDGCSASCAIEVEEQQIVTETRRRGGGGGGGSSSISTTSATWTCGDWSTCVDGKKTRTCTQDAISKKETQDCLITPTITVTASPANSETTGTETTAGSESDGSLSTLNFDLCEKTGGEGCDGNSKPSFITGAVSGIMNKAASMSSISWYALILVVVLLVCLPIFAHMVIKK